MIPCVKVEMVVYQFQTNVQNKYKRNNDGGNTVDSGCDSMCEYAGGPLRISNIMNKKARRLGGACWEMYKNRTNERTPEHDTRVTMQHIEWDGGGWGVLLVVCYALLWFRLYVVANRPHVGRAAWSYLGIVFGVLSQP